MVEIKADNRTEQEIYNEALKNMESFVLHSMRYLRKNFPETQLDIQSKDVEKVTPQEFLREYAWVVYTCGFNAKIISLKWDDLCGAYRQFDPEATPEDAQDHLSMREGVMRIIGNARKFDAIVLMMAVVKRDWEIIRKRLLSRDIDKLKAFRFIGDTTKYHLARNLGIADVGKPDIHIVRLAKHFKFQDPMLFIEKASKIAKVDKGIVDLAMWYFASDHGTRQL